MRKINFDILSEPLTFHYGKQKSHTSSISIILSIITSLICFFFGIFFLLEVIQHLNPTSFCYTRQEYDIGIFPINESSMFHFFTFPDFPKNENLQNIIEIFGYQDFEGTTIINYKDNVGSRLSFSHYTYSKCPQKSEKYKLNHIEDLIKKYPLNEGYCINGYYNVTSKKYITIDNPNFPYPSDTKGTSNPNYTSYQIIIQRCENDTFSNFNSCKSKEYIDKFMNENLIASVINMLTQEVDVSNFNEPIINDFFQVRFTFSPGSKTFSVSNLNFQPLRVVSFSNFFFNNKYEDYSYYFEQNDIKNFETTFPVYTAYKFWMQNKVYIYERNYKKFQNFMVEIGGIIKSVVTIAKIVNYIFCEYQTLIDIEKIMKNKINFFFERIGVMTPNKITKIFDKINNNNNINKNDSGTVMINNLISNPNKSVDLSQIKKNYEQSKLKSSFYSFSYIKDKVNIKNNIGIFTIIFYHLCHKKNKKGRYIDIIKWYYKQIISEQNMFDLYFFCSSIEKNEKSIFQTYQFDN